MSYPMRPKPLVHAWTGDGMMLCRPDDADALLGSSMTGAADVGVTCPSCLWAIRQAQNAQIDAARAGDATHNVTAWGWFALEARLRFVPHGEVVEVWLTSRQGAALVAQIPASSNPSGLTSDDDAVRDRAELQRLGWLEVAPGRWYREQPHAYVDATGIAPASYVLRIGHATRDLAAEVAPDAVREAQDWLDAHWKGRRQ